MKKLSLRDDEKIAALMKRLQEKENERQDLLVKLDRSLALQAFEPHAFDAGPCRVKVVGNVKYKPAEAMFHVITGEGKTYLHPLLTVPVKLWPESVKSDYLDNPRRRKLPGA